MNQFDRQVFEMHLKRYSNFQDFVLNGLNKEMMKDISETSSFHIIANKGNKHI